MPQRAANQSEEPSTRWERFGTRWWSGHRGEKRASLAEGISPIVQLGQEWNAKTAALCVFENQSEAKVLGKEITNPEDLQFPKPTPMALGISVLDIAATHQ